MKITLLENKKILIVGKGREGTAAYEYLLAHVPSAHVDIVDKADRDMYLQDQKLYDLAIKSPGIHSRLITIPYTTPTNIFLSNCKGKIIGVTGTKGKSTTSSLVYAMLKKQYKEVFFGGNIGNPALSFIDSLTAESWVVLELSSFQLQDINKNPYISIILGIAPEHVDFHGSFEKYIEAKKMITHFQTNEDFLILPADNPTNMAFSLTTKAQVYMYSVNKQLMEGCFIENNELVLRSHHSTQSIIPINQLKLLGKHNQENICAASLAAFLAHVSIASLREVLKTFSGLEHRLEYVGVKKGISFYNDSLATIPEATVAALRTFPTTQTLILGGHDRGLMFDTLVHELPKTHVKNLILFPVTGEKIWQTVTSLLPKNQWPEKFFVSSMKEAVTIAYDHTTPGSICLLSPASASFGLFTNYKDRGDQFKKEVNTLAP